MRWTLVLVLMLGCGVESEDPASPSDDGPVRPRPAVHDDAEETNDAVDDAPLPQGPCVESHFKHGVLESRVGHIYDGDRRKIETQIDDDLDGVGETRVVWTWLDRTHLSRVTTLRPTSSDETRFSYDGPRVIRVEFDAGIDGTLEYVTRNEHLPLDDGHVVRSRTDVGNDGTVDWMHEAFFDVHDRVVRFRDLDAAGNETFLSTLEYDAAGHLVRQTGFDDGAVTSRFESIWVDGREVASTWWTASGSRSRTTYGYDSEGRRIRTSVDDRDDGSIDEETVFDYACW